jgi:hypothetical protein
MRKYSDDFERGNKYSKTELLFLLPFDLSTTVETLCGAAYIYDECSMQEKTRVESSRIVDVDSRFICDAHAR